MICFEKMLGRCKRLSALSRHRCWMEKHRTLANEQRLDSSGYHFIRGMLRLRTPFAQHINTGQVRDCLCPLPFRPGCSMALAGFHGLVQLPVFDQFSSDMRQLALTIAGSLPIIKIGVVRRVRELSRVPDRHSARYLRMAAIPAIVKFVVGGIPGGRQAVYLGH